PRRRRAVFAGPRHTRPENAFGVGAGRSAAGACPAPAAQVDLGSRHAGRVKPAVVLLSGGLDSYTAAAIAQADGFSLNALTIFYGQRHAREVESARAVAKSLGVARHQELTVDLRAIGG